MKVVYEKTIEEKIIDEVEKAAQEDRKIEKIVLTELEALEFVSYASKTLPWWNVPFNLMHDLKTKYVTYQGVKLTVEA